MSDGDRLAYGGICPVCGEEFDDGFEDLEQATSYEGVRICIVDKGAEEGEALIHVPDEDEEETARDLLLDCPWCGKQVTDLDDALGHLNKCPPDDDDD